MGMIMRPDMYLTMNAITIVGKIRYKNLESFFNPTIKNKIVEIESDIPGMSVHPLTAHESTTGNDTNIKAPDKL